MSSDAAVTAVTAAASSSGDEARRYAMPRNLVLAASAGTGKTHALVGVIVHLLIGGRPGGAVDPARIIATTFSRKAASEIRARVSSEIERLALEPKSSVYVNSLREAMGRVSDDDLSKRARKALGRLPHARFGTLHSFATGIVQRYAVELGLGPGFELATEADARARADDAIARALEKRLVDSPNARANELSALAEAAGGIDRLVFSLRRVLGQLEEDGRSARDLDIDMSDARLIEAQMAELVMHARAISNNPRCELAAREMASAWDVHANMTAAVARGAAADADSRAIVEARVEQAAAALTGLAARGNKPPEVEAFFAFRNELIGAPNDEKGRRLARAWRSRDAFGRYARLVRDVVAEAEIDIEQSGRARATLGFGEVLRAARELLRDRPDVAHEVSSGIEALLVDEFQDTSRVQRDLIQLLWASPESRPKAGFIPSLSAIRPTGLLVVGDRKQSIYGFRGADVGVFAELAVGLAGAPAREALGIPVGVTWEPKEPLADFHALRHNRRSVPSILAFANAFSARRFQVGEPPPELFEIEYVPSTEDLLTPPSLAATTPTDDPTTTTSTKPSTTWLRVHPKGGSSTRLEEALVIAERIQGIVASQEPLIGKSKGTASASSASASASTSRRAATFRDIAVLATTNGMLDAVAFALAQSEIPYVVAGKSFFRAREISDLSAMLSVVLDPTDRLAILEVLRGPWAGLHDETLLGLVEPGKGLVGPSQWSSAPPHPELVHDEDRAALAALSSLILSLGRCAGRLGAGAILREAVTETAFESVLAAMPRGQQRVANVQKLLAMADRHPDARAFRRWLSDAKDQEVSESEAATFSDADDAVRLLTVHASKGLDFPIVFVPEIGASLPRSDKGVARVALGSGDNPNILSVRIADDASFVLESPSYTRAHANTRRRERAERQRLAYVAITRASDAMFLVGGRSRDTTLDPGASTLAVVEALPPEILNVVDVEVPAPTKRADNELPLDSTHQAIEPKPEPRHIPKWRVLPIAPTALSDFNHCARRFELIHLLGLPEHHPTKNVWLANQSTNPAEPGAASTGAAPRGSEKNVWLANQSTGPAAAKGGAGGTEKNVWLANQSTGPAPATGGAGGTEKNVWLANQSTGRPGLDARARGTIAHGVLELLPLDLFLGVHDPRAAVARALENAGVPKAHPEHNAIARRVLRFLRTDYIRSIRDSGATIMREVAFVLPIDDDAGADATPDPDEDGRHVTLRGSMDLVVAWPDGAMDVVDYKSARPRTRTTSGIDRDNPNADDADATADDSDSDSDNAVIDIENYAFQLDVYALAAWAKFPNATSLRAGLAFLGGGRGEPMWRDLPKASDVKAHITKLGAALVNARWNDAFPRVLRDRCEAIHCGFISRCHPPP